MEVWDPDAKSNRQVKVENGVIKYCAPHSSSDMQVITKPFKVKPGHVTFEKEAAEWFDDNYGPSYIKRMLLSGFSTFIRILPITYETDTEDVFKKARFQLKDCPVNYIYAPRVSLRRLTPSWVRKLKKMAVPVILFYVETKEEIEKTRWQRLLEAAFPLRLMFIFDCKHSALSNSDEKYARSKWEKTVKNLRINSFFYLPEPGEEVSRLLLQRIGLYPKKGSFDSGSDADYFLYFNEKKEAEHILLPEIIILKGKVVKAGTRWFLEAAEGGELNSIIPEQFLPINAVHKYL
ncbi:hypothetical protein [Salipaludibacillus aurantiacus]|nr:hypothetical protein [Salipaludibacillus aurantiacus]